MKLKFQVVSDIHLEFRLAKKNLPEIKPCAHVLILAGDIGNPFSDNLQDFLKEKSKTYDLVLYVPGNHEFYNHEYYETKMQLKKLSCDNIKILDKSCISYKGVKIIGATLWTYIPQEKYIDCSTMRDYSLIKIKTKGENGEEITRDLFCTDTVEFHKKELEYIKKEVQKSKEKNEDVIVITHHSPLMKGTQKPMYEKKKEKIHNAFVSDLKDIIKPPIKAWVFGHTHWSSKNYINNIPVVSNQIGYVVFKEPCNFNPNYILEI